MQHFTVGFCSFYQLNPYLFIFSTCVTKLVFSFFFLPIIFFHFKCETVLFYLKIGTYLVLPLEGWRVLPTCWDRVTVNYCPCCTVICWFMQKYTYIYHHHHHHIVLAARISLTLSRHSSLSFIALGRSSGQQPVSSHSCWMYVRPGRPAFARPCVGIYKSTSLMSSSLLLQQCPACLVRLTWIVFVIGGRWPYSWCLVGCCCQDLFRIARSILV